MGAGFAPSCAGPLRQRGKAALQPVGRDCTHE